MNNRKDIPYLMALVHAAKWRKEKINNLLIRITVDEKSSVSDFFNLTGTEWTVQYGLSGEEVTKLEQAKNEVSNYSFMAEDLFEQGYDVIPLYSEEYPDTLKSNMKKKHAPSLLYIKGNKKILKEDCVAIVGSRKASEISLQFTDNIAKKAAQEYKVVVSGFAKGVDRQALDSAIKYNGQSIIVLPQGIMEFGSGYKNYYKQIVNGDVSVLSTFHPKAPWAVPLAMSRNSVIYGLAKEIYVAESSDKGGTWSGVLNGLKKSRIIYVRQPEQGEKNANEILINKGCHPVDQQGQKIEKKREALHDEKLEKVSESGMEYNNPEDLIIKALQKGALTSKEILQETKLDWKTVKLSKHLKGMGEIEVLNKRPKRFQLKGMDNQGSLF